MTWLERIVATACPNGCTKAGASCGANGKGGIVCASRIQAADGAPKPSWRHRLLRVVAQFGPHDRPVLECGVCGTWVTTRGRKYIYSHDNGEDWNPGPDACPGRRP